MIMVEMPIREMTGQLFLQADAIVVGQWSGILTIMLRAYLNTNIRNSQLIPAVL
jgi:hypothetical protein